MSLNMNNLSGQINCHRGENTHVIKVIYIMVDNSLMRATRFSFHLSRAVDS